MKKLLATLALGLSLGFGVFGTASVATAQTAPATAPAAVTAPAADAKADAAPAPAAPAAAAPAATPPAAKPVKPTKHAGMSDAELSAHLDKLQNERDDPAVFFFY